MVVLDAERELIVGHLGGHETAIVECSTRTLFPLPLYAVSELRPVEFGPRNLESSSTFVPRESVTVLSFVPKEIIRFVGAESMSKVPM